MSSSFRALSRRRAVRTLVVMSVSLDGQAAGVEPVPEGASAVDAAQIGEEPTTRSQHPAQLGEKGVHGLIAVRGLDVDHGVERRGWERHDWASPHTKAKPDACRCRLHKSTASREKSIPVIERGCR